MKTSNNPAAAKPLIRQLDLEQIEYGAEIEQEVLFSPATRGSPYMKFELIYGLPGAQAALRALPGDQMTLTLKGEARVAAGGQQYSLPAAAALMLPAGTSQTVQAEGTQPWLAIRASCDECPLMRQAFGNEPECSAAPVARKVDDVAPEMLYGFERRVLFSPATTGSRHMKFAVVHGRQGAASVAHTHPGGELALTLAGHAMLNAQGERYDMTAGTALAVPPAVRHPAESLGPDEWVVVTSYCDECPLIRQNQYS